MDNEKVDIVFASWGVGVTPEIAIVRAINSKIPIVHYLPTFPTSEKSILRERVEVFLYNRIVGHINGFILGSKRMEEYFRENYSIATDTPIVIGPLAYSDEYFIRKRTRPILRKDNNPHVIFTGTTDFSKPYNDVRHQIEEIADSHIHVYCIRPDTDFNETEYIHFFDKFDTPDLVNGKLAEFMTQFDAALVLYNRSKKGLRYELSVPNRFLTCFTACIPICIPKDLFPSCEDIISELHNGIIFNDVQDLNIRLRDVLSLNLARENAFNASHLFKFDNQKDTYSTFLRSLVSRNQTEIFGTNIPNEGSISVTAI